MNPAETGSPPDCIFCKIARREIPANEVERDETVVAFRDLNPQAPHHVLVVPLKHAANLTALAERGDAAEIAALVGTAARIGRRLGPRGYRIVINEGDDAGQTVHHVHVHVLAGRPMRWPPG